MSVADVDGSIEATAAAVSAIIKKPPMKEKFLTRPPFRFLHDVVMGIINATGWQADLYEGEEKKSKGECFGDKPGKAAFFEKLIGVVNKQLSIEVLAVCDHHQRWVLEALVGEQLARQTCHLDALASALGMPDHATLSVAAWFA